MRRFIRTVGIILACFGLAGCNGGGSASVPPTGTIAVSAGAYHTLALLHDGTVWAWGANAAGQLGDNTWFDRWEPVPVVGMTDVVAIAAGQYHSFAVKRDGTVWAWGMNNAGTLGNGESGGGTHRATPVQVSGLSGITAVSSGDGHALAVKDDGTVWAWGWNAYGQLGDGTTVDRSTPVRVSGISDVVSVSAGGMFSLAVKRDGTAWSWGRNGDGQLGDGTTVDRSTPVRVAGLTGVRSVSAGWWHALAVDQAGAVWSWGSDAFGSLGGGQVGSIRSAPGRVVGLERIVSVAAGNVHSIALKDDGTVWYWGSKGDGSANAVTTPFRVAGLGGGAAVTTGEGHMLVLGRDGLIRGWGSNLHGQLGDGRAYFRPSPVLVTKDGQLFGTGMPFVPPTEPEQPGGQTIAVSAGAYHTLALRIDGTVWAWGANDVGQLGDNTSQNRKEPVPVVGLADVVAIDAGQSNSFAMKRDGTVWAWGPNDGGQLGNGESGWATSRSTPVQVSGLSGITAVSSGWGHTLAVKDDGTVWAWGGNAYGQLGDGTTVSRSTPVRVAGLSDVVSVSAGNMFSLAVKRDGTAWSWGRNDYGQLGNGEVFPFLTPYLDMIRTAPVQVIGLSGVRSVAAGYWHAVAVDNAGDVWSWGSNAYGSLGNGLGMSSPTGRSVPGRVIVVEGIESVAAGNSHTLALKSDGTVWYWGFKDGSMTDAFTTPFQVAGVGGGAALTTGESHMLVLGRLGRVRGWGANYSGQLGDGTLYFRSFPVFATKDGLPF